MELELTPEQTDVVRRAIETGRFKDADEAVREALALWVKSEEIHDKLLEVIRHVRRLNGDRDLTRLVRGLAVALGHWDLVTTDDPFHAFDEWDGEADRKAYADL